VMTERRRCPPAPPADRIRVCCASNCDLLGLQRKGDGTEASIPVGGCWLMQQCVSDLECDNLFTDLQFGPVHRPTAAKKGTQPAHSATDSRTSRVLLSDLDLATPEGVRVARERLHREARRLCNQVADERDLSRQLNFVACVDETLAKALR